MRPSGNGCIAVLHRTKAWKVRWPPADGGLGCRPDSVGMSSVAGPLTFSADLLPPYNPRHIWIIHWPPLLGWLAHCSRQGDAWKLPHHRAQLVPHCFMYNNDQSVLDQPAVVLFFSLCGHTSNDICCLVCLCGCLGLKLSYMQFLDWHAIGFLYNLKLSHIYSFELHNIWKDSRARVCERVQHCNFFWPPQ